MGLIARFLEDQGIPTASVYFQREMIEAVPAPRMMLLRWPFGHPFGEPDEPALQAMVLRRLLKLSRRADRFGHLDEPDWPWRRTPAELPRAWARALEEGDGT